MGMVEAQTMHEVLLDQKILHVKLWHFYEAHDSLPRDYLEISHSCYCRTKLQSSGG